MNRNGIIYKITSPSGKVYVGQTLQSFKERVKCHKKVSSNCTLVKRAINKYGDKMIYEIIEEAPEEKLDEREAYWIKTLNSLAPNGYNCSTGGNKNKVISQVIKDKIRESVKSKNIERNGYLGCVVKTNNGFVPRVSESKKQKYLSNGAFKTENEAIEVLKEYTRDPENFVRPDGSNKKNKGCVYKDKFGKWHAKSQRNYLGTFDNEENARNVLHQILHTGYTCKKCD